MSRASLHFIVAPVCLGTMIWSAPAQEKRPHVEIRGIYGGIPDELMKEGKTLAGCGINAVWTAPAA